MTTNASARAPRWGTRAPSASRAPRRPCASAATSQDVNSSLRAAKRPKQSTASRVALDCFASLAMTKLLREIEEMPPGLVLGLDDPGVGIEADFLGKPLLDRWLGQRLLRDGREEPFNRPAVVIDRLRRRSIEHGAAVHGRDLDEDGTSLLGAAPAYRAEHAGGLAAAQIGRHPNTGLQSHGRDIGQRAEARQSYQSIDRMADHRGKLAHEALGDLPGHRKLALTLEFLDRGLGVGADVAV